MFLLLPTKRSLFLVLIGLASPSVSLAFGAPSGRTKAWQSLKKTTTSLKMGMTDEKYDVIIIGSGPAGSTYEPSAEPTAEPAIDPANAPGATPTHEPVVFHYYVRI
jgi:hypothetical protein